MGYGYGSSIGMSEIYVKRRRAWCVYYNKGRTCIAVMTKCIGADCYYYKEDYNKRLEYEQKENEKSTKK